MITKEIESMKILIDYCKSQPCDENCIFWNDDHVCGIHNPSAWKGVNNDN